MKPAPFEYSRPASLAEACALLASEEGAQIIAGGQTLVPMMAMRLARPTRLVDIGRIPELSYVRDEGKFVAIGAVTRQCVVESDALVATKVPLLAAAMRYVGHAATRTRGTIGGSLANADPAAEIALVAVTLEATLCYREGTRNVEIQAAHFFVGAMTTALPSRGCLAAVRFPVWSAGRLGVGFHEVNARRSDFAFVSAAAQVSLHPDGTCQKLALGIGAATEFPIRLHAAEQALLGTRLEQNVVRTAIADAVAEIRTLADLHASAEYRRRVAVTLVCRGISDAVRAAQAQGVHAH
jgi:CO/xanthine dehydrogenase FAD-binding subunit